MPDINEKIKISHNHKCPFCGKPLKQRTSQQNRALYLYFTTLANVLNDAGLDMKKTIRQDIDIPWNGENIKNYLWKPVMKAQFGYNSTTQMTTRDIDKVFDVVNRAISERTGIAIQFPSIEVLMQLENV